MKHEEDLQALVQEGEEAAGGEGGGGGREGGGEGGGGEGGGGGKHVRMLGPFRRREILKTKRKGLPAREHPFPPFTLRKMTGSTGRTS